MKPILLIVQYHKGINPSQRFRLEMYEKLLMDNGFNPITANFIDASSHSILYKKGFLVKKIWAVIQGFAHRFIGLFSLHRYDFIFIMREATPVGPPIFEWIYSKVFKKKIIYDFDDALWAVPLEKDKRWMTFFKCYWKTASICKWAYKVSAGNQYLYDFAKKYNKRVILNPTCVDTNYHITLNTIKRNNTVTIGWTGTFSTLVYLDFVVPILQKLEEKYDISFLVIADKNPSLPLKRFKFITWNLSTEIEDLLKCDIGIMPLKEIDHSEAKCGFKIIQFLSLNIPVVASPIGVNNIITGEKLGGFLCTTEVEWFSALESLIADKSLRTKMGADGREQIEKHYSLNSNANNFISLFQ